jgi:lipoyl-dependent peroxiredoxin subunit D
METSIQNETLISLAQLLKIEHEDIGRGLVTIAQNEHKYIKDLKVNVSNALNFPNLNKKESTLLALGASINDKNKVLIHSFEQLARENGANDLEIADVYACVSLLSTNNVFYRFRHFTKKEYYETAPAGIKMSIMMNPVIGKEFFELVSLAISALNGCELCVNSHEDSLIKLGASEARIYDAIRLVAIIRGLSVLSE